MGEATPICRCRVLYLGSAVPRQSKDGLQGIQEPLRSLYPSEGALGARGIDSWLSVWSNGILLENVDENLKKVTRFFPIESLHYCAAVRQVLIPERGSTNAPELKFLPLDSPFARMPKAQHPPIFAAILRRTTGIKVLECHVFICKKEAAANALVRCCFHAYADNSYAKQLENGPGPNSTAGSVYGTIGGNGLSKSNGDLTSAVNVPNGWRSRAGSTTTLNSIGRQSNGQLVNGYHGAGNSSSLMNGSHGSSGAEGYQSVKNIYGSSADLDVGDDCEGSIYNGDENHKVWNGSQDQLDNINSIESPYEIFSGNHSTLGRPARARQIAAPIPVPPPPLKEELKKKSNKKMHSKSISSQSLSGTLIRPKPIHGNSLHRAHPHLPQSSSGSMIYGPVVNPRQYHTLSHRYGHPNPGLVSHSGYSGHHHIHQNMPAHPSNTSHMMPPQVHSQIMMTSPMAAMHQIPVMLPQQYATLQPSRTNKKKKSKDKKSNGGMPSGAIPVGMPLVPPIYGYHQGPQAQSVLGDSRPIAMSNRKLAQSAGNGLDDSGSGAESPGGTGIYRRKGHLNERAFSYSIRQEHRSRSHGSLASLQFNPPDMKKEREIAQMVAGLELNDGEPRHVMHRKPSGGGMMNGAPMMNGASMMNGNGVMHGGAQVGNSGYASFGKPRR